MRAFVSSNSCPTKVSWTQFTPDMGNKESNESAAVKRQAEGGANPMYELLDLSGKLDPLHRWFVRNRNA